MNEGGGRALVRRLAPPDAHAYRALMLDGYARDPEAFTATVAERGPLPLAVWEARVAPGAAAGEIVMGALVDCQLAGAVGLAFADRPKLRHKATLFGLYVAHHARRRGLGRLLVEAALDEARRRAGIVQVQLTVTQGTASSGTESSRWRCWPKTGLPPRFTCGTDSDRVGPACEARIGANLRKAARYTR